MVRISVRGLTKDDQVDLSRALKGTDLVRGRMNLLSKSIKSLALSGLRDLLQSHVKVWRNIVKHRLEDFIKRFLFPLKELDTEGRLYRVFLENFTDRTLGTRSFSLISDGPVYGGYNGAYVSL